jgi:type III secretory pathway component EscU
MRYMRSLFLILMLFFTTFSVYSQIKSADCVYEIITDSINYVNYDYTINNYRSITTASKTNIKLFQISEVVYIIMDDYAIKLPYKTMVNAQLVYMTSKDATSAYIVSIAGVLVLNGYDAKLKNFTNIVFYRTKTTTHYYAKEFEKLFKKYKRVLKKADNQYKKS